MINNCINKNTNFYKTLINQKFNEQEIAQITDKLNQESFNNWYGKGKKDTFDQPIIIDNLYIDNDKGQRITLFNLLNDKFYTQRQNYTKDLTYLDKIRLFIKERELNLKTRIIAFKNTEYAKNLQEVVKTLDDIQDNDYLKALQINAEDILKNIESIKLRFYQYDSINKSKESKEEKKIRDKKYKNFLRQSKIFLDGFTKVKNLDLPFNKDEQGYQIIKSLKDIEQEATILINKVNAAIEENFREVFEPLLSNPDIKNGVVDFLAAQTDESKIQLFLDSLGDSDVYFNAAIDKLFKKTMYEKSIEEKELLKKWKQFSSNSNFDADLKKILEYKDGKTTGKFIQKYNEEYYDKLFEYTNTLQKLKEEKKENTEEFNKVLSDYFNWKKDNTEQEFVKEYYEALNNLIPKARAIKQEIDLKKKQIQLQGNLTIEDYEQLEELDNQLNKLKSSVDENGNKKTGEDLEIANSLSSFSRKISEFYTTIDTNTKGFEKAKKEAKEKGEVYYETWLKNNTVERFTDDFEKFFNNLLNRLPKSEQLTDLEIKIKQLVLNYRNDKGELEVENIPKDVLLEYNNLVKQKKQLKKSIDAKLDLIERRKISNEFNKHIKFVPTSYYNKLKAEKLKVVEDIKSEKGEQSKEYKKALQDYTKWYNKNHEKNEYTGEETPISIWTTLTPKNPKFLQVLPNNKWRTSVIKNEYRNPKFEKDANGYSIPNDNWINENYKNLDSKDLENLNYIKNLLLYLTEHTQGDIIKQGYLPAIKKTLDKKTKDIEESINEKYITEAKDIVRLIPFKYVNKINQISIKSIPNEASKEEAERIEKENKDIREKNKLNHSESLDYNLKDTMEIFIKSALTSKYKHEIETDLLLAKEQLKSINVIKTNAKGNIFDKLKSQINKENTPYEVSAIGSNTQNHFEQWLEAIFYEDYETSNVNSPINKTLNYLQNATSLRNIAFNPVSALNNSLIGNIQNRIEALGGIYFSSKDFRYANINYFGNITSYFANHGKLESNNKIDAFIKDFDIIVSQDELANKPQGLAATIAHKAKLLVDVGYFMQHITEHEIQNTNLLAMSNSHRIVDGKILNFNEFYENKKIKIEYNNEKEYKEAIKNVEINYKLENSLKEEFKKYPTVFESYELKNGYNKLKENIKLNDNELFNFRERVIGINQRLHGIYNREDASLIQRHILGRLAMQFRKYMRPAWNRRFGRKFGQKVYNEKVRDYEEGLYVTTFKFLSDPFVKNYKEYKKEEEKTAIKAFQVILKGLKSSFLDAKIRWGSLSELEKSNIKRSGVEFAFLVSVFLLAIALKNIKGDDNDDDERYALTLAIHQANRLIGELSTFSPIGIVKEGNRLFSSPAPILKTIEDIYKLGANIIAYPFQDEEDRNFKTGIYHGKSKVEIYTEQVFPITKQYINLKYMQERDSKFK